MSGPVYTRDRSSGRIHKRVRVGNRLYTDEADNLDDAGEYDVIGDDEVAEADPEALCDRCFPREDG